MCGGGGHTRNPLNKLLPRQRSRRAHRRAPPARVCRSCNTFPCVRPCDHATFNGYEGNNTFYTSAYRPLNTHAHAAGLITQQLPLTLSVRVSASSSQFVPARLVEATRSPLKSSQDAARAASARRQGGSSGWRPPPAPQHGEQQQQQARTLWCRGCSQEQQQHRLAAHHQRRRLMLPAAAAAARAAAARAAAARAAAVDAARASRRRL